MSALYRSRMAPGLAHTRLAVRASPVSSPAPLPLRVSSGTAPRPAVPRGRRDFHPGVLASAFVDGTAHALTAVHQAGLPWYLAIPLLAVGVNFTIRLPLQYYSRVLSHRRRVARPLVIAWNYRHAQRQRNTQPRTDLQPRLRLYRMALKSARRIYKDRGCQFWKTFAASLASFGPFILVTEALRQMTGSPTSTLARLLMSNASALDPTPGSTSPLFDISLAHGGAAWFPDLTAMDPYMVLPFLTSGLLVLQLTSVMSIRSLRLSFSTRSGDPRLTGMERLQISLRRAICLMPLIPLCFLDLPSAIFLYWATSFGLQNVNRAMLERYLPRPHVNELADPRRQGPPFLVKPESSKW